MTSTAFIDPNILVYHLTQNHGSFSPRCSSLMDDLADGRIAAACSGTVIVIVETIYVLEKGFLVPKPAIHAPLKSIVSIAAIEFDFRAALLAALDFWLSQGPISFADCYHLALTRENGLKAIYTFDKEMGRYPGVERIEP